MKKASAYLLVLVLLLGLLCGCGNAGPAATTNPPTQQMSPSPGVSPSGAGQPTQDIGGSTADLPSPSVSPNGGGNGGNGGGGGANSKS